MYFSTASLDRIEMKLQFWLVDSISIPFHLETTPSCYLTALNLILSSPTRFFCSVSLPQVETFRSKSKEKNSAAAIKSNHFFRKNKQLKQTSDAKMLSNQSLEVSDERELDGSDDKEEAIGLERRRGFRRLLQEAAPGLAERE